MQKSLVARAKLLFFQSKPIAFFPSSLRSPSSLLKLPIKLPSCWSGLTMAGVERGRGMGGFGREGKLPFPFLSRLFRFPPHSRFAPVPQAIAPNLVGLMVHIKGESWYDVANWTGKV